MIISDAIFEKIVFFEVPLFFGKKKPKIFINPWITIPGDMNPELKKKERRFCENDDNVLSPSSQYNILQDIYLFQYLSCWSKIKLYFAIWRWWDQMMPNYNGDVYTFNLPANAYHQIFSYSYSIGFLNILILLDFGQEICRSFVKTLLTFSIERTFRQRFEKSFLAFAIWKSRLSKSIISELFFII